jgi:flagellar basal body-associated protein FliL
MGDDEFTGAEEAAPRKKASMTTIIIVVVVAVVMGAAGFFTGRLSLGGSGGDAGKEVSPVSVKNGPGESNRQTGSETGTPTGPGSKGDETIAAPGTGSTRGLLKLDTFTVNLDDPFGRRYIEVELNLVIEKKELISQILENELLMPKIRHEIFMTISAKSYKDLKGTAGKIALFEEIQMRVNEIIKQEIGIEPVVEVLQTKFLIQ